MTRHTDLLTLDQVAELLAVSPETVRRWCKTGRLPYLALPSGRIRVRRSAIDALETIGGHDD